MKFRRVIGLLLAALILQLGFATAYAQYNSSNYKVDETYFGTGGAQDISSDNYRADATVGSLGAGRYSSANYRSEAGFMSTSIPFIALVINTSSVNLGVLSAGSTAYGSASFSVTSYLAGSYVVTTMSAPLTSTDGAVLNGMTVAATPTIGTEQFGINLVANTVPASVGANLVNVPDNSFADGRVGTGYNTPNYYKYVQGDIIASSPLAAGNQAIGRTDYTITYIANIGPITAAGNYTMVHAIVVTGTY